MLLRVIVPILFFLLASPAVAVEITGRVVAIADGDTLTVLTQAKEQVRVRLAEIDTPESRQPYGNRARQALAELAFGKAARVVVVDTDRYGRKVGRVYVDGQDVNAEMILQGAAWVYRTYNHDPSLLSLESEARAAKRGLWALPEAERTPPWEWRSARRESQRQGALRTPPTPVQTTQQEGFSCAGKRYCNQMASCAEARFYLSECGLSRLDGDDDGVPCEKICR